MLWCIVSPEPKYAQWGLARSGTSGEGKLYASSLLVNKFYSTLFVLEV